MRWLAGVLVLAAVASAQGFVHRLGPACQLTFADIVTDTVRNRLIVVDDIGLTWEWDGARWREKAPVLPATNLVFDPVRRRVLAMTVSGPTSYREYDGHDWVVLPNTTPAPGVGRLTFHGTANRVWMLGGAGVHEWDGTNWTFVGGIPATAWARLVWDSGRQRMLLLSHANIDTPMETHVWNGAAWQFAFRGGPTNHNFGVADDPVRGRLVAHGGGSSATSAATWEWDGTSWRAIVSTGFARRDHALAFDPVRGQVLAFGGHVGDGSSTRMRAHQEAHAWNGAAWQLVAELAPPSRQLTAAALDVARGRTVLFGGRIAGVRDRDLWEFDGVRWLRRTYSGGPSVREAHAMATDPTGGVLLFGGVETVAFGDFWHWDGSVWTPINVPRPSPRMGHGMALDALRGRVVLHGGQSAPFQALADTWEWDGVQWTQVATNGPISLFGSVAMTWDPFAGGVVVLMFPIGSATFLWDGLAWQQIAPGVPDLLLGLGFDAVRATSIAVTRRLSGRPDTWELRGGAWVPATGIVPPVRGGYDGTGVTPMVLDQHGQTLWYGGTYLSTLPVQPAGAVRFGAGCAAAAVVDPALTGLGLPRVGDDGYRFDLRGGPQRSGVVGFATSSQPRAIVPGCDWWLGDGPLVLVTSDAAGNGGLAAPIAAMPLLRGLDVFAQLAWLEPLVAHGFVLSAPLALRLGE